MCGELVLQVCPYLFEELSSSPWLPKDRLSSIPFKIANSKAPNQPLQPAALLSPRSSLPWLQTIHGLLHLLGLNSHTVPLHRLVAARKWTSVYSPALNTLGLQLMLKCLIFFDVSLTFILCYSFLFASSLSTGKGICLDAILWGSCC